MSGVNRRGQFDWGAIDRARGADCTSTSLNGSVPPDSADLVSSDQFRVQNADASVRCSMRISRGRPTPSDRHNRYVRHLRSSGSLFRDQTTVTIRASVAIDRFISYRRGLSMWPVRRLAERVIACGSWCGIAAHRAMTFSRGFLNKRWGNAWACCPAVFFGFPRFLLKMGNSASLIELDRSSSAHGQSACRVSRTCCFPCPLL